MQQWAELSGGRAFTTDRAGSIAEIMEKLQALVLRRYRLRYSPDAAANRTGLHHVKIIHKDHADFQFSFVPFLFLRHMHGPEDKRCKASPGEGNSGGQVFPAGAADGPGPRSDIQRLRFLEAKQELQQTFRASGP